MHSPPFSDTLLRVTGGIESFDEGLDRHIWSLSDQSLQWDGEIAKKRREKPREIHRLMTELLETQHAVDEQEAQEYAGVEAAEETLPDCMFSRMLDSKETLADPCRDSARPDLRERGGNLKGDVRGCGRIATGA